MEEQGPPRLEHVPVNVVSEGAEEYVRSYAILKAMVDRPYLEIDTLERTKGALHSAEVFVTSNRIG